MNKRLDIVITGTKVGDMVRGGRYEGSTGFLVMTKQNITVRTSVYVKVGANQSRIKMELLYIDPLQTNARPTYHGHVIPGPLTKEYGRRVVIIGPDTSGDDKYVGRYGLVTRSDVDLSDETAYVLFYYKGMAEHRQAGYYRLDSLCASDKEAVEWDNMQISPGHHN